VTDPPGEDQFVLLNDQPVDETDDDALGMAEAVSDLVGLILGSRGAAPFTLAIDAGWGMGKSSLMLQLQNALNGHRNQGVVTSWFNAWTAQESDALAGLIKSALMGEPEKALRRTLWRVARHRGLLTALHAALVIAASFFHLAGVVDQFWDLLSKDASSRNAGRRDLDEGFSRWAKPTTRRPDGRLLVVFIDDLDRCTSEVIVTVCEAMRLYLALPGVVFVIGCDQNLLVEAARNTGIKSQAPESLRYLEKIIQMTYRKPAPDEAQMIRLAKHWASRSQTTRLVSESIIWPIVIRRTGHNPRRLKTLINSFILEYRLASAGVGVGLLFDKVILQHLYPAFYGVLARPGVQEDTAHDFLEYVGLRRCITDGSELSDAHKEFFKKHSAREPLQNEDPRVALERLDKVLERVDKGIFSLYSSLAEDPELIGIVTGMCDHPDFAVLLGHMQSSAPAVSPATSLTADPGSFTADPGTDAVAFSAVPGGPVVYEPDKGLSAAATGGDDGTPPDRGPALAGQAPSPTARFEDASTRRWKVFVGSAGGLYGYRQVARDVLEDFTYGGWHCFEPVMMENYGARPDLAREVGVDAVRGCDMLVGILGLRYGGHPPDDQISYTELEFQTATECGLSRLMFLLDELAAGRLEGATPEAEDRKDRQARFRSQVAASVVSVNVVSEEDFGQRLTQALEHWVREESFKRDIVDHSEEFKGGRRRLLQCRQIGGATLIYGERGTGKTTLLTALRKDVLVQQAYGRNLIVRIVQLRGAGAVERVREEVHSALADLAGQAGVPVKDLWPVMIVLDLQLDVETGRDVDEETQNAVRRLFTWDTLHAVVLAETSSRELKESLERDLGWARETVITVGDYDRVEDALEQMRRDAPSVGSWPEPDTRTLAEALGLRPISLFAAAKDIEAVARRAPNQVPAYIRKQLEAIGSETAPAGESEGLASYGVLVRGSIDRLSPQAKDLLRLMTVLQPKPGVFPDEIAVALDLDLDLGAAVHAATEEDDGELDAEQLEHRDRAYELVGELVGRGLLERLRRRGAALGTPPELTLHPAKVQVIRDYLPLDDGNREKANERAEAFYRVRVGETVSGSFDSRSRMEQPDWWDDAEEWIYHVGHVTPGRAVIAFTALFLDAWWWWDLYVKFDFCDQLLDFAERPRVRAVSPQMREVARLLAKFRDTYPREHEVTVARLHAEIAGSDPGDAVGLRKTTSTGAGIIPILKNLCDQLRITELDALFADVPPPESAAEAPSAESTSGEEPGEESDDGKTRLHLLGLICLFVAEGYRFRASLEPGGAALAAAEACYRRAESYFQEEEDAWDQAWTRYLLGEVLFQRGEDPEAVWEAAAEAADFDSDTELLANIERARGDYLLAAGDLEGALAHYGRAVFYGVALQVTSNLAIGPNAYTKAFYREICLHATRPLARALFEESASTADGRLAETKRRLNVMLAEWGDYWKPDERKLDEALGSADRRIVEQFAGTIAAAAFWPAPGEADLGEPESQYCQLVNDLIEKTETQPWVKGLQRWREHLRDK
jgi:hypothetical protein